MDLIAIRLTDDVPELTGPDLMNYGPFKKGDVAEIPYELAVLIVKKDKGQYIELQERNFEVELLRFPEKITVKAVNSEEAIQKAKDKVNFSVYKTESVQVLE